MRATLGLSLPPLTPLMWLVVPLPQAGPMEPEVRLVWYGVERLPLPDGTLAAELSAVERGRVW